MSECASIKVRLINSQSPYLYIQHPLLEAIISLVREQNGHLMKQGAVLVDDTDEGSDISVLFLMEHAVQDGRSNKMGAPNVISQKLQFASIDSTGNVTNAVVSAPHLNLRAATTEEISSMRVELDAERFGLIWKKAIQFATVELAQRHLNEIRDRRLPEIDKVTGD